MPCCNRWLLLPILLLAVTAVSSGQGQVKSEGKVAVANCNGCHGWRKPVEERRKLNPPHNKVNLTHGAGAGLWCLDCHQSSNPALLKGREGEGVPFARVEENCLTCHNRQARDWGVGVHGKRLSGWQEERSVARCPTCHNPHSPRFIALVPSPPPAQPRGTP
ncbi:MAG: hypothetical protein HQL55_03240 [Magnetococcales bacterium]|nr:hypothetical protein [Magnetococcales bacterium]